MEFVEALEERGECALTPATFDLGAEGLVHLGGQRLFATLQLSDEVFVERKRHFALGLGHTLIVLWYDFSATRVTTLDSVRFAN